MSALNTNNIDIKKFKNIKSPEYAYVLGLLWADGYITKDNKRNCVSLSLCKSDAFDIENIILKTGKWKIRNQIPYNKDGFIRQDQTIFSIYNRDLNLYLKSLDYHIKSGASAMKVLNSIPEKFKHFWWRGYFDGDGCLYTKGRGTRIMFYSVLDQCWDFYESLIDKLNINKYSKFLTTKQGHKSSTVTISNFRDCIKILKYITIILNKIKK